MDASHSWIIIRSLISACGLCILSGCFSQASIPQDYYYRLPLIQVIQPHSTPRINGSTLITQFKADGVHRERPIIYINARKPLELKQYHYRNWIDEPGNLIQESFYHYCKSTQLMAQIELINPLRPSDNHQYQIDARVIRFERIIHASHVSAMVSLHFSFARYGEIQSIVDQTYQAQIDAPDTSIHSTIEAFSSALKHIFDAFLQDIANHNKLKTAQP